MKRSAQLGLAVAAFVLTSIPGPAAGDADEELPDAPDVPAEPNEHASDAPAWGSPWADASHDWDGDDDQGFGNDPDADDVPADEAADEEAADDEEEAAAAHAWGSDRATASHDWDGDEDQGFGNDPDRREGTPSEGGQGHAWGNDESADCHDWTGDDDEGFGNDPEKKDTPCAG